ncbi:hypothetical protein [Ornithinimicrobium kibberense]
MPPAGCRARSRPTTPQRRGSSRSNVIGPATTSVRSHRPDARERS